MINTLKTHVTHILSHKGLKLYGANMSWLFLDKFIRMLLGFSVGVYVARKLGPGQFGCSTMQSVLRHYSRF